MAKGQRETPKKDAETSQVTPMPPSDLSQYMASIRRPMPFAPEILLGNVLAQYGADLAEGTIEAAGQRGHSCRSREGNQSQNQQILHQTLASFIIVKANQ